MTQMGARWGQILQSNPHSPGSKPSGIYFRVDVDRIADSSADSYRLFCRTPNAHMAAEADSQGGKEGGLCPSSFSPPPQCLEGKLKWCSRCQGHSGMACSQVLDTFVFPHLGKSAENWVPQKFFRWNRNAATDVNIGQQLCGPLTAQCDCPHPCYSFIPQ